jgi:hypothetical protein
VPLPDWKGRKRARGDADIQQEPQEAFLAILS